MNVTGIIAENKKRLTSWRKQEEYNPYSGEGSTSLDRVLFEIPDAPLKKMWLPKGFINDPLIRSIKKHGSLSDCLYNDFDTEPTEDAVATLWDSICERRFKHDFEFWAAMTITITPKDGGEDIPFILNPGQRKLLKAMEKIAYCWQTHPGDTCKGKAMGWIYTHTDLPCMDSDHPQEELELSYLCTPRDSITHHSRYVPKKRLTAIHKITAKRH